MLNSVERNCGSCQRASNAPLLLRLGYSLLLLIAPAVGLPAQEVEDDSTVTETITVIEASVVVELPDALSDRDIERLKPRQLVVFEDEAARMMTHLTPLAPTPSTLWHFLIYLDAPLSRPETLDRAITLLAQRAAQLTAGGEVKIVLANPQPTTVLPPTRSSSEVERALLGLASDRPGSDRIGALHAAYLETSTKPSAPLAELATASIAAETRVVQEQLDHLLRMAGEGCPQAACLLILLSDGYLLQPELYYQRTESATAAKRTTSGEAEQLSRATDELAQALAAYEWITLPLLLQDERIERDATSIPGAAVGSDFDRFRDSVGNEGWRDAPKWRPKDSADPTPAVIETLLLPITAPLRRIADVSSGALVQSEPRLVSELERLSRRWRLWYHTPQSASQELRAIEVHLVRQGIRVPAPAWIRTATPLFISEARLRGALAGLGQRGTADVAVERGKPDAYDIAVAWGLEPPFLSGGPVRLSLVRRAGDSGVKFEHRTLEAEAAPTFRYHLTAEDANVRALLVEHLSSRQWGVAVLD
jgi:hypothetical protein